MKKKYEKPMILIENFSLSTTIAGDCEVKTNTPSLDQCGYVEEDGRFTQEIFVMGVCATTAPEGHNGICYHTFEANSIFNS